jgi:hypothetical protein
MIAYNLDKILIRQIHIYDDLICRIVVNVGRNVKMYCRYFQMEVKFCQWDLKLSPVCIKCKEENHITSTDSPQGCDMVHELIAVGLI